MISTDISTLNKHIDKHHGSLQSESANLADGATDLTNCLTVAVARLIDAAPDVGHPPLANFPIHVSYPHLTNHPFPNFDNYYHLIESLL